MNFTKEQAKEKIGDLVENFDAKIKFYKSDDYKEAQLEDEYLKPFLRCLNWNVSSEGIRSPAEREVIVQAKGKRGKEPDYLLQLEGKPRFYIEAKHPKYKLWKETGYIWQAYSYAYSTQSSAPSRKVDFSLLTDFEEFRFFDCTFKPTKKLEILSNFVSIGWEYPDYIDKFGELWDIFEKNQVKKGSLESRYLSEKKIKENRIPPDKAFLDDLDNLKNGWRVQLAKDIHKFNPNLDSDHITAVAQLVLDRFIFIKVLSDREIEDDYLAQIITEIDKAAIKSERGVLNQTCRKLFGKLNQTYNGSIFQKREELDNVFLSNRTLAKILKEFLPENSRYNFKQIPVEILGKIYEQFLGKVVVVKNTRTAIEEKLEVRKAGGVYYTPQYIVDYIVENTVGEKLKECKSVEDIFKIKICDPACGSGSFLLGAYEKLTQWALTFYTKKIKPNQKLTREQAKNIYLNTEGEIHLTSRLKREILSNCIYGVDIDHQAVELAKTSLSLKMLENTRHDELYEEVTLFHEQVLPNLDANIKCGNSLIGSDFYEGKNLSLFDIKEKIKINVFDWDGPDDFSEIMKQGGFDVVIGNPPYVSYYSRHSKYKQGDEEKIEYLIEHYNFTKYSDTGKRLNTVMFFIEKGINILKVHGLMGQIVDMNLDMGAFIGIRQYMLKNVSIIEIVKKLKVFEGVNSGQIIFILENKKPKNRKIVFKKGLNHIQGGIGQNDLINNPKYHLDLPAIKFFQLDKTIPLEKLMKIKTGVNIGGSANFFLANSRETENYLPFISVSTLKRKYQEIFLSDHSFIHYSQKLAERINHNNKKRGNRNVVVLGDIDRFRQERIFVRQSADAIITSYSNQPCVSPYSIFALNKLENKYSIKFLLGLLNSNLITEFAKNEKIILSGEGKQPQIRKSGLSKIPIIKLNFSNKEKAQHDRMVSLVDQMLIIQKKLHEASSPIEKKQYQKEANILDQQIDNLVYELYELTPEEIKIVEGEGCIDHRRKKLHETTSPQEV